MRPNKAAVRQALLEERIHQNKIDNSAVVTLDRSSILGIPSAVNHIAARLEEAPKFNKKKDAAKV